MQVETSQVGITVGKYLQYEIGNVNIEDKKIVLEPFVKKDKLLEIHIASDLFDYFKHSGLKDSVVIEALKQLLRLLCRNDLVQYIEAYEFLLKTLVGTTGAEKFNNVYKKIAREVEAGIGQKDANSLKNEYKDIIDSVRTLQSIQNVNDLLSILEDRDVLNNKDVQVLEDILDKFGEATLKKLVVSYKTLLSLSSNCEICGCENVIITKKTTILLDETEYDELETAMMYLWENLGPDWKRLARALKINEAKISSIQKDNLSDTSEQVIQMLNFWRKTHDDASVASLVSALRSRICNLVYLANEIERKTYKHF